MFLGFVSLARSLFYLTECLTKIVSREEVLHELEAVTDRIAEAEGEAREVEIQQRQISYSQVIEFHSQAGGYIMKHSM